MLEKQKKSIDIHEYWQIYTRRKIFLIVPFCLCLIIGIIICLVSKPVYESSTVIQISTNQELSRAMASDKLVPGITPEQRYYDLTRIITSHTYLKRLIEVLNLYNDPKMQKLAEKNKDKFPDLNIKEITELFLIDFLRKHIGIKQEQDFVQITMTGESPELVYKLVKRLTQVFVDESLRSELGGIREALEFSSEQLVIYKKKLDESEERLRKFRESLVRNELQDQPTITSNIEKINSMLTTTDFELLDLKNRLASLEYKIKEQVIYYQPLDNDLLNSLKAQYLDAAVPDLAKLNLDYSWDDARLLKINSVIEDLRDKIRKEVEREIISKYSFDKATTNIVVQREILRIEVDFLKRKRDALDNLSKVYKTSATSGPSRDITLVRLQNEVEANRQIYHTLLSQTRGTEIEEALQKTSAEFKFKIIEPPIRPIKPVSPRPLRITLLAIVIGCVVGFGLVSLLEHVDHSFKNVENIEKFLNLSVLGTLPPIEMEVVNKKRGKSSHRKVIKNKTDNYF